MLPQKHGAGLPLASCTTSSSAWTFLARAAVSACLTLLRCQSSSPRSGIKASRLRFPHFHYFFVPGETHTMLGSVPSFSQNGVSLTAFLNKQVTDDATWSSAKP